MRPAIKEELCILPPEPVYEELHRCPVETFPETSQCQKKNFLILLNNITLLKSYTEKLKATIQCLSPGGDRSVSSVASRFYRDFNPEATR